MLLKKGTTLSVFMTIALFVRAATAQVTAEQVDRSIQRGVEHLQKLQKHDGRWAESPGYPGGLTALCTLALINAGVEVESASIQRALEFLRSLGEPQMVYSTALQTMVFCAAEPEKHRLLISRNVQWLESVQVRAGPWAGGWKYSGQGRVESGDNSNSQFALLALYEAERVGVAVRDSTWQLALQHWTTEQHEDGSWSYSPSERAPRGSMVCAGISSLVIALGKVSAGDARISGDQVECCGQQIDVDAVERGLAWLAKEFSVARNPRIGSMYLYYYLYGLERVGRQTGRRFIGQHDWFREGAEFLLSQQNPLTGNWIGDNRPEENSVLATSFALLFLSKGRRPVVLSQLQFGADADWNRHRGAVQSLTRRVERTWGRDLTWQTIDLSIASAEDLIGSPILFISGRDGLRLTRQQREQLKQYVDYGGFLFVEGCCGGTGFDNDFRQLMAELFPESSLRLLPPEHPVWYADGKVNQKYLRPLYGVDACCRTSIVYCPGDLSCYWELSRGGRAAGIPATIKDEIEACLQIGQNVVAYATNRELRGKLERPTVTTNTQVSQLDRGVLVVPKLLYGGGGDDAPNSLPNLLSFVADRAQLRVAIENRLVTATAPNIFEYPILYMQGRRGFRFTEAERNALAKYLARGGLVFGDAICASKPFADAFRREFSTILGGDTLQRVSSTHELFSDQFHGFRIQEVTLRDPTPRTADDPLRARLTRITPLLEGAELDGRLAVIFSPYDLSCAMEYSVSLECRGYIKEDAARIGLNVILFALQQ